MLIPYFSHPWEILWTGKKETFSAVPAAGRETNWAVIEASNATVVKGIYCFFGRTTRSSGACFVRARAVAASQLRGAATLRRWLGCCTAPL